jgi:5-formyltetrahydrofolate cyclo-ligase
MAAGSTTGRLQGSGGAEAIGFAFAAQELPALPAEPTDQPLDTLVTEQGCLERGMP